METQRFRFGRLRTLRIRRDKLTKTPNRFLWAQENYMENLQYVSSA
jgi:hypothetical protein